MNQRSMGYEPIEDSRLLYSAMNKKASRTYLKVCTGKLYIPSIAILLPIMPTWHNLVLRGIANPVSRKGFPGSNPGVGVTK